MDDQNQDQHELHLDANAPFMFPGMKLPFLPQQIHIAPHGLIREAKTQVFYDPWETRKYQKRRRRYAMPGKRYIRYLLSKRWDELSPDQMALLAGSPELVSAFAYSRPYGLELYRDTYNYISDPTHYLQSASPVVRWEKDDEPDTVFPEDFTPFAPEQRYPPRPWPSE